MDHHGFSHSHTRRERGGPWIRMAGGTSMMQELQLCRAPYTVPRKAYLNSRTATAYLRYAFLRLVNFQSSHAEKFHQKGQRSPTVRLGCAQVEQEEELIANKLMRRCVSRRAICPRPVKGHLDRHPPSSLLSLKSTAPAVFPLQNQVSSAGSEMFLQTVERQ